MKGLKGYFATALSIALCFTFSTGAFAQGGASTLGTLTGIVSDTSKARLPGVSVRVVNEDTGVANQMLTNDNGDFSFLLSPGTHYKVTAEFTGFSKSETTKITVRAADVVRLDIALEVGDIKIIKTVEASRNPLFNGTTQDVGNLLTEVEIQGLPMVGNDPLTLITTLPGYRANPLGHEFDTVGGLPMNMINTVRDGLSVTDELFPNGVSSGTILNPDMIQEIRLILSPVDAEAGRGNGQVQITTRSGTNKFQWNINYNIRQNALNALGPSTTRVKQPFGATFQYLISVGGPIIKNRTFYFVNWDHQLRFQRGGSGTGGNGYGGYVSVPALTDLARNGVYRFWDGYASVPYGNPITVTATDAQWPIDQSGTAVSPQWWVGGANSKRYTGTLRCYSVFGTTKFDGTPFDPSTDCGTYIPRMDDGLGNGLNSWVPDWAHPVYGVGSVPGGMDYNARLAAGLNPAFSWEAVVTNPDGSEYQIERPPDRTGYIQRLLSYMPRVNNFTSSFSRGGQISGETDIAGADGLNRAAHEWVRGQTGVDNINTFRGGTFGFGTSLDQANVSHKIINLKLDHVIDSRSRVSLSTSLQDDMNSRLAFRSRWPDGINGYSARVPRVLTINGISTLSPNMVNEARFGLNLNRTTQLPPWDNPADTSGAKFAQTFLQQGWVDPRCTGANPGTACQKYGDVTPIYYTPGNPGTGAALAGVTAGTMNFQDNILPAGANTGFGNADGTNSGSQCAGTSQSINCEAEGKLFNFADTFSWNHGAHSIRAGGEFRFTRTREDSASVIPNASTGASNLTASLLLNSAVATAPAGLAPPVDCNPDGTAPCVGGWTGGGRTARAAVTSTDLLYFLSGSVQSVSQTFWANSFDNFRDGTWGTWSTAEGKKTRNSVQNEYALFIKDDWKIGKRLTLNLGVRYENYGNLYTRGFATGILDGGLGLFGPTRMRGSDPFQYWMTPGTLYWTGYGLEAPAIDVRGSFLPNGDPSYIPGTCDPGSPLCGVLPPAGSPAGTLTKINVGGRTVQQVASSIAVCPGGRCVYTSTVACVYGIQQSPLLPVSTCDPSLLTTRVFVGPDSNHPELSATYIDRNNIGPAIGFSWRAPFVGNRTLLVRGGFQFTYGSAGRDRTVGTGSGAQLSQTAGGAPITGTLDQTTAQCTGAVTCLGRADDNYALTLYDLPNFVPLADSASLPAVGGSGSGVTGLRSLEVQNFTVNRTKSVTAFINGYQDPRTENYTFSVSTNLSRTSTLAISYVGTLGKNRPTGINLNTAAVYTNPELLEALQITRAGGDAPLFDQMFAGLNLTGFASTTGWGPVGSCFTPGTLPAGATAAQIATRNALIANAPGGGAGNRPAGTYYQSGSAHLRHATVATFGSLTTNLANGNFARVGAVLADVNPPTPPNGTGTLSSSNGWRTIQKGSLLRNGCDRLASTTSTDRRDLISGTPTSGNQGLVRCFPEDWLIANPTTDTGANPLLTGTTGQSTILKTNWGWTNYQQLQFQYTLRVANSVNMQATYLTSKTIALPRDFYRTRSNSNNAGGGSSFGVVSGFSDPRTEESRYADHAESSDSLKHALRLNGVFPLPFGPGQRLLGKSSGIVAKILGGWQMGIIYNLQSGQPFSISAGDMLYGDSSASASNCNAYSGSLGGGTGCPSGLVFPDVVSPLWTNPQGKMQRNGPNGASTYYGNPSPFAIIPDPQCASMVGIASPSDVPTVSSVTVGGVTTTTVTPFNFTGANCTLKALVMKVPQGTPGAFTSSFVDNGGSPVLIMLQNPLPGKQGNLGAQTMRQPGRFYLDANLSKTFMFSERRGIQFRIDATNVLNHPTPADLYFNIGPGGTFNDQSTSELSALSNGCFAGNATQPGNAFCGRQVQFGIRMINN